MKKLIVGILTILMFSFIGQAKESSVYVQANGGQAKILSKTTATYGLGIGTEAVWHYHIYTAIDFNFDYANALSKNYYTFSFLFKPGYNIPFDNQAVNIYAIVGGAEQTTDPSGGAGFGYGGGVEYRFTSSFAISAEYKTFHITTTQVNTPNYTYDIGDVSLKYLW